MGSFNKLPSLPALLFAIAVVLSWNDPLVVHAFTPASPLKLILGQRQQVGIVAVVPSTQLFAKQTNTEQQKQQGASPFVLNLSLVRQTLLNQALIGFTIWTGGAGYQALQKAATFTTEACALAVAGAVPLILFSRAVETSESPVVADLNTSTNMLVLRLFGNSSQPFLAAMVSLVLAAVTGIVEEVTFRGQVLPQIYANSHDYVQAVALTTLLFAVLHLNPLALLRGGTQGIVDGAVLVAYQLVTGFWFAMLFLVSGNLAVSIVAHACFDFYVFFATHLQVTAQMEYARSRQSSLMPAAVAVERKWVQQQSKAFVDGARETFYLADTNKDGVLSREEVRIALASYGIRLSAKESERVTTAADLDASGTIDFGEFLEFIGPTGKADAAIKNSLLGVN